MVISFVGVVFCWCANGGEVWWWWCSSDGLWWPSSAGCALWRPFWGGGGRSRPRSSGGRGWLLPGAVNSCLACRSPSKSPQNLSSSTSNHLNVSPGQFESLLGNLQSLGGFGFGGRVMLSCISFTHLLSSLFPCQLLFNNDVIQLNHCNSQSPLSKNGNARLISLKDLTAHRDVD